MSRLSTPSSPLTSSRLSMASTTTESQKSDLEPLFPTRWEDEREMDKGLKILKRKKAATTRLRKMNNVAERILETRVRSLNTHLDRIEKQLRKETNFIQDEIKQIKPVKLPRIESSEKLPLESRSTSAMSEKSQISSAPSRTVSRTSNRQACRTCLFDPDNTRWRCKHFPCYLPQTYHSLGVFDSPNTYSVVGNYKQLLRRCRDLRPATSQHSRQEATIEPEEEEIDFESHAPRTTIKEKIRGLKQLVKEMKEKNEKHKPREWAVNYGEPIPRRIILKPVKTLV